MSVGTYWHVKHMQLCSPCVSHMKFERKKNQFKEPYVMKAGFVSLTTRKGGAYH